MCCNLCGSLVVECCTWADVNTGEYAAGDDSIKFRCLDCGNGDVISVSEYLSYNKKNELKIQKE